MPRPREPYEHERQPGWKAEVARALDDLLGGTPSEDTARKKPENPAEGLYDPSAGAHHSNMEMEVRLKYEGWMEDRYAEEMGRHVKGVGDGVAKHLKAIAEAIPLGPKAVEMALLDGAIKNVQHAIDHAPQPPWKNEHEEAIVEAHLEYLREQHAIYVRLWDRLEALPKEAWTDRSGLPGSGYADPSGS